MSLEAVRVLILYLGKKLLTNPMQNDGLTKLNFFKKQKAGSGSGFYLEDDNPDLDPTLTVGPDPDP